MSHPRLGFQDVFLAPRDHTVCELTPNRIIGELKKANPQFIAEGAQPVGQHRVKK